MTAVISLPHGFSVHYDVLTPGLQDTLQRMPFAHPAESMTNETPIIVADRTEVLGQYNFDIAIFLDTSCSPRSVPDNTLILQVQPGISFTAGLVSLVTAISQGNAHSLLQVQNTHLYQLEMLASSLEEAVLWTNEKLEILNLTDSAATMLKQRHGKLVGLPLLEVLRCDEDDLQGMLTKRAAVNASDKLELQGKLPDGSKIFVMLGIRQITEKRYQINLIDVSSQRAADKRFIQLANYDPMTGLANRGLLFEFLQHATGRSKRSGRLVALMLLDLDHFNRVSDETGAQMGDDLLKNAASRIKSLLHDQDMLARWGGDELAIVMEDLEHPDTVSRVAQRILSVLSNPFVIGGRDFYVSPSMGIAVYPEADETVNGLIQAANTAMFEAKKDDARNTYRFYQSRLQEVAEKRALLEQHLRRALDNEEFEVYYQPKVSIRQERVIGFEALLRWRHPEWNMVSPEVYIPVAEECGLIGQIGDWVLRQACSQMARWQNDFPQLADCSIAVNVSPKQLSDSYFAGRIAIILAESRLDVERLEIEITESSVMEHPEEAIKLLNKIHDLGVKISIDDFGTGYSSLSYLKKLPLDCIKIDRSFVIDIGQNESTESIIQAILVMSSKLGLFNVAEGIETSQQMAFFEGTPCDLLQGYMFSKPMSAPEVEAMFSAPEPAMQQKFLELAQLSERN